MPCRDWMDVDTNAADERITNLKSDMGKIRIKLDTLTRLLCEAVKIISDNGCRSRMSKELMDWSWAHVKEDRKRNR